MDDFMINKIFNLEGYYRNFRYLTIGINIENN